MNQVSDIMTRVMSADVEWCYEDDPIEEILDKMRNMQIRRVPVIESQDRLVGMVSLGRCRHQDVPRGGREPIHSLRAGSLQSCIHDLSHCKFLCVNTVTVSKWLAAC
jgi:predicted transcriptional regulator